MNTNHYPPPPPPTPLSSVARVAQSLQSWLPAGGAAGSAVWGWPLHFARLVGWEVTLLWRRRVAIALVILLVLAYALMTGVLVLAFQAASQALQSANPVAPFLSMPGVWLPAAIFAGRLLPLLIAILAGAYVGGEFSFGTLRLVLIRGTTRLQLVLAQTVTLAINALLAVALVGGMAWLSATVLGSVLGIAPGDMRGMADEVVHLGLAMVLSLLLYALTALFFAVLGRSVAAGIGGGFALLFFEAIADNILPAFQGSKPGTIAGFLGHLPEWLPVENTTLLMAHAGAKPLALAAPDAYLAAVDATHALWVIVGYCVALVALAYLILWRRDVRE